MTTFTDDNKSDQYYTNDIRHSKAKNSKDPFVLVEKPRTKSPQKLVAAIVFATLIVGAAVVTTVLVVKQKQELQDPNINPAGSELTNTEGLDVTDPEQQRIDEQHKLSALLDTVAEEDWAYANAVWNTIFPAYLTDCDLYDYYNASEVLSNHIEAFPLSQSECVAKATAHLKKCSRSD